MAPWRVDGKLDSYFELFIYFFFDRWQFNLKLFRYYSATIDQILEDGTCTVIFDGYSTTEISQVYKITKKYDYYR